MVSRCTSAACESFSRKDYVIAPAGVLAPEAKNPRRHLRTPRVIERDTREERMVGISGRLYNRKKSRFDRLYVRKVSTFFQQMVLGCQQRDTYARTCGIGVFATNFVLGSDLEFKLP